MFIIDKNLNLCYSNKLSQWKVIITKTYMHNYRQFKTHKMSAFLLAVMVFEFGFPHHVAAVTTVPSENSVMVPKLFYRSLAVVSKDSFENGGIVRIADKEHSEDLSEKIENSTEISKESTISAEKIYNVKNTYKVSMTAYSSTVDQTDSSPCITADGFNVCENNEENVVAANFLPFGTKIMIPELFGDRVFTVHDRMNARYHYKVDVWMKDRQSALKFGVKYATIVVVE